MFRTKNIERQLSHSTNLDKTNESNLDNYKSIN